MNSNDPPTLCQMCRAEISPSGADRCPECSYPIFRFTDRAREVLSLAIAIAQRQIELAATRKSWWHLLRRPIAPTIRPRHVLAAICDGPRGVGYQALLNCGADPTSLAESIKKRCAAIRIAHTAEGTALTKDATLIQLIKNAMNISHRLGHTWVGTEHLLLALIDSEDPVAHRELKTARVTMSRAEAFVIQNGAAVAH